jgi:WD40 repeat protein
VWDVFEVGHARHFEGGHKGRVKSICFARNGSLIATGSKDHRIILWEAEGGTVSGSIDTQLGSLSTIDFSPSGCLVACGSSDNSVKVFERSSGDCIAELKDHADGIVSVCFSPDGALLASCCSVRVNVWDVAKQELTYSIEDCGDGLSCLSWSPDGQLLANSSTGDEAIRVWSLRDIDAGPRELQGSSDINSIAFFPRNGRFIASACGDNAVRIWSITDQACVSTFSGHDHPVTAVSFSAEGEYLASFSQEDKVCKLWYMYGSDGECRSTISLPGTHISTMALTSVVAGPSEWMRRMSTEVFSRPKDPGAHGLGQARRSTIVFEDPADAAERAEFVLAVGDFSGNVHVFRSILQ